MEIVFLFGNADFYTAEDRGKAAMDSGYEAG